MNEQLRVTRHLSDGEQREKLPLPRNPNDSELLDSKLRDHSIKKQIAEDTFRQ